MKGLELSKAYYFKYGAEMLHEKFPELETKIAVGLFGSGSECLNYDDGISEDHDFEPGFCIVLPENSIDERTEFQLRRAYSRLPEEFMGYKKAGLEPVGGSRHGVIRADEFFTEFCGSKDGTLTGEEWLRIPEYALLQCVNGEIFRDDSGFLTKIRERLTYLPHDIRLKKLAGTLLLMEQSGEYNFERCIKRGDGAAAQLSVIEFVNNAMHAVFLVNGKYMPYYKWRFRALSELERMSDLFYPFEYLLCSGNTGADYKYKSGIISDISRIIVQNIYEVFPEICGHTEACANRGTSATGISGVSFSAEKRENGIARGQEENIDLEKTAYLINGCIPDEKIRNMHILSGV